MNKWTLFNYSIRKSCLALAIVIYSQLAISAAQDDNTLNYYLKKTDYINVKLSPDGKTYFAHVRGESGSYLIFIDRESKKPISSIKAEPDDLIYDYHWIDNQEVVYRFGRSVWWSDRPVGRGSIVRYRLDRKRNNTVSWGRTHLELLSIKKLPGGKLLAASWDRTRSGRVRPYIGKLKPNGGWSTIETLPFAGAYPMAAKNGQLSFFNLTDQEFNHSVYHRAGDDAEWEHLDSDHLGSDCVVSFVNYQSTKAYLNCDSGEQRVETLFEWDAVEAEAKQVFPSVDLDFTYIIRDPETGEAAVGVYDPGKVQYVYRDGSAFAAEFKKLVKAFAGQRVSINSQSDDGKLIVLFVSGDTNPGEFYLYDRSAKKAEFLMAARSWMAREKLQPMEALKFKARDGLEINAYLTRAKNNHSSKLIVYPHGGPHGVRERWGFDEAAQLLSANGYNVLQVNFRGSDGYGLNFKEKGYRNWGTSMVDDVIDATKHAKAMGLAGEGQVCIMGGSYGAFSALSAVARAPDLYRCAIGDAGVYDLPMIYQDEQDTSYWRRDNTLKDELGDNINEMAAMSPVNLAERIKAKIFLIHGKRDRRTPIEQAEAMRDALQKAGQEPEWLVFRDSGHGVAGNEERFEYYEAVLGFLNKQL